MGPKGRPDTQTNWSTDCWPQEELNSTQQNFNDNCRGLKVSNDNTKSIWLVSDMVSESSEEVPPYGYTHLLLQISLPTSIYAL
jgi:hypothetical protein